VRNSASSIPCPPTSSLRLGLKCAAKAGSFYILDRGYLDFARWHRLHQCGAFFVTHAKQNFRCARRYSRPVDKTTGLRFNQTVVLTRAR